MTIISIHSVPRSGSSWLLSVFDSSENTKCVYQPLWSYTYKNRINEKSKKENFELFIDELRETDDEYCCMKTNYHTNNGKNQPITFYKKNKKHVVMKHTTHHYLIEKFIRFNKNIKIIGLIRNPENVIESQMKAKHEKLKDWLNGTDKNTVQECYFGFNKWLELNKYFIQLKEKYHDNVYLISYENLLKDTNNEIEKLFRFCGIKLNEQTLNFIDKSTSINDNYDYSVFRNKENLMNKKCKLDETIKDYIKDKIIY